MSIEYRILVAVGLLDHTWYETECVYLADSDEGDAAACRAAEQQVLNSMPASFPVSFVLAQRVISIEVEEDPEYEADLVAHRAVPHRGYKLDPEELDDDGTEPHRGYRDDNDEEDTEEEEDEEENPYECGRLCRDCPVCGEETTPIGVLGRVGHYRCRYCGDTWGQHL